MNSTSVIKAWLSGKPARTSNKSLSSDGEKLFSYRLEIGFLDDSAGKFVIYDYRAPNNFISTTTSKHVGLAVTTTLQVKGDYWIADPPQ